MLALSDLSSMDLNNSSNVTEIDNDYVQNQIYNEFRRTSFLELWRHVFGILGCLISVFGIVGNILSIFILLKPASSNDKICKYLNERYHSSQNRRSLGSFEHKLASFYAYLIALSFCDLFSCIFSILNMLEYIPPPYVDWNLDRYRKFYLSISVYTHPIAITLQALSVWIVCAFSVHRCRSIINPSNYLTSQRDRLEDGSQRNYFCRINLKNNCSHQTYELKFYTKAWQYLQHKLCLYCFCTFTPQYYEKAKADAEFARKAYEVIGIIESNNQNSESSGGSGAAPTERCMQRRPSQVLRSSRLTTKLNKARLIIFVLYLLAIIYLIPQMFEKRVSYIEIHHKTYVFITITELGRQRWFRQIFHLWFYLVAIYILPFCLIVIFNLLLLRTYLMSKKRCQRYKLRTDPNKILRDYNSSSGGNFSVSEDAAQRINLVQSKGSGRRMSGSISVVTETTTTSKGEAPSVPMSNLQRINNFRRRSSARLASIKLDPKGRALTLTLFGVAAIFFICHFPAAITKVIYVLYPRLEFEEKSRFASICLDTSNFLIMVNSSINFLLYIVFGPGKFRQEFSLLCHRMCGKFGCFGNKTSKYAGPNASSTGETSSGGGYRTSGGLKKCSISISENNFAMVNRVNNSIVETNESAENGVVEEVNYL